MLAPDLPSTPFPGARLRLGTGAYAVLAGIAIFAATDPIYPTLMRGPSEWVYTAPGLDSMRRLAWLAIYAGMLGVMVAMRARLAAALAGQSVVFLAMAWFLLSSLWAVDPREGIVGGVQAIFTMGFGILIGARLGSEGILRAFFVTGVIVVAATLFFVVVFPAHAFGFRYNTGALRGIYVEKNHLALVLSYTVWAAVFTALTRPRSWWLWGFAGLSTMLCVMTISSIALMQLMLIFGCVAYALIMRGRAHRGALALVLAASALAFLALTLPVVLGALGEDMTFNGRTTLWGHLWLAISERPFLGHGYRGFWDTEAAEQMRISLGWAARGAHNVWLQALLWGGVIGLALWVWAWAGVVRKAGRAFAAGTDMRHVAIAVLVFMTLLWSLFETTQLQHFTHNAIVTGMVFALRNPRFR
jgi:O-antigen ligase